MHAFLCLFSQLERARLAKERQMREEAQIEKDEMERKMRELEESCLQSQEALVSKYTPCIYNINRVTKNYVIS